MLFDYYYYKQVAKVGGEPNYSNWRKLMPPAQLALMKQDIHLFLAVGKFSMAGFITHIASKAVGNVNTKD
jgi:hypothetical protein